MLTHTSEHVCKIANVFLIYMMDPLMKIVFCTAEFRLLCMNDCREIQLKCNIPVNKGSCERFGNGCPRQGNVSTGRPLLLLYCRCKIICTACIWYSTLINALINVKVQ